MLSPKAINRLRQHVVTLAAEHGISICQGDHDLFSGMYDPAEHRLHVAPVRGAISYAIALHELGHGIAQNGHCLFEHASLLNREYGKPLHWDMDLKILQETFAWEWAMQHALIWTDAMTRMMRWAWNTYESGQRRWDHDTRKNMVAKPTFAKVLAFPPDALPSRAEMVKVALELLGVNVERRAA